MNKKTYVAPIAERMMFVPAEDISTSSGNDWFWKWKWGAQNYGDVSAAGTNGLWDGAFEYSAEDKDPY